MDVEFNEPVYESNRVQPVAKPSALSKFVMKTGLASDDQGAQRVMLILLILVLIALGAVLVFGFDSTALPSELAPLDEPAP